MKALMSHEAGGADTLQITELEAPHPKRDEVRISVRACGINYPDALIIEDKYQFRPQRPFAPGGEVVGVVDVVGEDVSDFKVGDRVIGMIGWGGMAEKVTTKTTKCTRAPTGMPDEEAAAFVFTYGTSYHALKQRARLQSDQTVLVLGAAGGVGLAAVEIAKAMGARVIAAASSEEKVSLARKRGADDGLVYPPGPFEKKDSKALAQQFKDVCGGDGADVIYDAVGGGYAEPALRAIAWEGKYLVVGFPAGIPSIPLNLALLKGCQIVGVFWGAFCDREPDLNAQNLEELAALYTAGKVQPYVSANYPLVEGAEGIKALAERRALGKIVISI
tara:strand:+ start:168 stop:1163 length:996 start_codon:yes stop_codon:yes gene_type:complete